MKTSTCWLLCIAWAIAAFSFGIVNIHQDHTISQQKALVRLLWTDVQRSQAACK